MSQRLDEYLAGEATDYLEQLDELLAEDGPPEPERLLRLSTGVRGSTDLAGAGTIARVAHRLEEAAQAVVAGTLPWSESLRSVSQRTIADMHALLRALDRWGPEEERRVDDSLSRWSDLLSPSVPQAGGEAGNHLPVVPIETLFYDDDGPHVIDAPSAADASAAAVVPIEDLLFRGEAALQEALRLRPTFEEIVRSGTTPERLSELVAELFDLLNLGLSSTSREA